MKTLNVNDERFLKKTDAESIQAALDAAGAGDTVLIPRYNAGKDKNEWRIVKALEIPSGVTVLLDNCYMVQETGCYENMFTNKPGARDFAIIGEGNVMLSGGQPNYLLTSTQGRMGLPSIRCNALMRFVGAKNFTVKGFAVEFPRWATINLDSCEYVTISEINFNIIPHLINLVGIQIDCGCHNVNISNLTGSTGIATVTVSADEKHEKIADGDIYNLCFRNICTDSTRSAQIFLRTNGGYKVHDVELDTIVDCSYFYDKRRPAAAVMLFGATEIPKKAPVLGDMYNIKARNMYSRGNNAIAVSGDLLNCEFRNLFTFGDNIFALTALKKNITLENVTFERIYYGKGSEPNNSASFISRQAKGSVAVKMDGVNGNYKIEKLVLEDEEEQ